MITLFIDTAKREEIVVRLRVDGKEFEKSLKDAKAEKVLPLIEKLLKEKGSKLKDLNAVEVNPGPGSFTGLRVGISIANALGFALKIPVNGKVGKLVLPVYNQE